MSRLGGVFPFPPTSAVAPDVPLTLPSGGTFTFPKGNWLVAPGTNSRVQFMDPVNLQWRSMQGTLGGGMISSDGCNYRLINITGTVTGLSVTAAGSGATNGIGFAQTGVAVSIAASPIGGPYNATAYAVVGGLVMPPTVTQAGSGFVSPPVVVCDAPPPGGQQATAICTLTAAGAINTITITNNGCGYLISPNWYIFPEPAVYYGAPIAGVGPDIFPAPGLIHPLMQPAGTMYQANLNAALGALLTPVALQGSGTVTGAFILDPGGGYITTPPVVTITGAGAATATSTIGPAPTNDLSFLQSRVQ